MLYTRSMEFYDRKSFRIEGVEGEFDRICRSLGLSGPEDFAIPAAAWEAMKVRSSSDILPRLKLREVDEVKESKGTEVKEREFGDNCKPRVSDERVQDGEFAGNCEDRVPIRISDECVQDGGCGSCTTAVTGGGGGGGGGGGIKGTRPPMLKPPPGMRVSVVDNASSTWDLLRDFAPRGEGKESFVESSDSDDDDDDRRELRGESENREEEGEEEEGGGRGEGGGGVSEKREEEEEENALRLAEIVAELSASCSFTSSNEDDSSSTTTSNNISPNGRFRRSITNWQKGELLGRGSFGSVYEGISE